MVDVSIVDAVDYYLTGITVALNNSQGLLINSVGHKILGQGTVVAILDSGLPLLGVVSLLGAVVVEVFNVYVFNVTVFHLALVSEEAIHALLAEEGGSHSQVMFIILV